MFGNQSLAHMKRRQDNTVEADWNRFSSTNAQPAYRDWVTLLAKIKRNYQTQPIAILRKISAFCGRTAARRLSDWSFDPQRIHVVGIGRREEKPDNAKMTTYLFC